MMKKLLFLGLLGGLFSTSTASAQIYYETGFENHLYNPSHGWSGNFDISHNDSYVCTDNRAASKTVYSNEEASLISPNFNSDGTKITLSFKYKVGSGYSWQPVTPVEGSQFDIKIEYSTDNGTNWTTKENLNSSHTATTDCTEKNVTFAAGEVPQGTVKFRFYVKNKTNPSKILNFAFDDIVIMQSASIPECPSNITFTENHSGCSNYGGKITWNSSAMASSYEVKVGTTSGGNDIHDGTQTSTEYNISYAAPGQTFYYTIKAKNSLGTSSNCTEYSYTMPTTGCYCEANSEIPDENYIISFSTIGGISNINNQNTGYSPQGYTDYTTLAVTAYANAIFNFKINAEEGTSASIWIDYNNNYSFDNNEKVVDNAHTNNGMISGSITLPSDIANGNYRMRVRTNTTNYGLSSCGQESYGETEDYTLTISDAPSCIPANQLSATLDSTYTANLSWNGDNASTYQIEWGTENFTQGNGTIIDNISGVSYNLTGFSTLNTNYSYYVRKKCSETEYSIWSGPYTFYVGYCKPNITQNDGNGIPKVVINDHEYTQDDVTYANHYDDPVELNAGTTIPVSVTFAMTNPQYYSVWLDKNDDFTFESNEHLAYSSVNNTPTTRTFTIDIPTDISEGIHHLRIYTSNNSSIQNNPCYDAYRGVLLDFAVNITNNPVCVAPSGLNVENISGGKKLKWNGNGTDYSVEYGVEGFTQGSGTIVNNISSNEYSVTDFPTIDTNYQFYVRNNCASGTTEWIGPYTFFHGYCLAQPNSNSGNGISKFTINAQEYTQGDVTYFDHTGTPADVQQGVELPIEIKFETGNYTRYYNKVWVDMNNNLVFEDNEMFDLGRPTTTNALYTTNITLPVTLENGNYRMRYFGYSYNRDNPCYSGYDAVALDFVLNVNNSTAGTITHELESLKMYPNPAHNWVSISNTTPIDTVEIFDINGRRIYKQTVKRTTLKINIQDYAKGSYIIRITSENKISTKQLIIK